MLRFDEPVTPIVLRVLDAHGTPVLIATPQATDATVRSRLPQGLPDGAYLVSWRVTSADAHPVGGSFLFAVGARPVSWRGVVGQAGYQAFWFAAVAVNRALHLAALMLAAGAAAYLLLVVPSTGRPAQRETLAATAQGAAVFAGLTAIAAIALQGAAVADFAPESLFGVEPWKVGLSTSRGPASLLAAAGMGCIVIGFTGGGHARQALAALGAAAGIASFALAGHAASAHPSWLFLPALLLHTAIAAFWIGSLLPLHSALRQHRHDALPAVRRFSRIAMIGIPLLVAAGVCLALVQLHRWEDLTASRYGLLLLAKLTLVAVLLGLAAWNRQVLTPALARRVPATIGALRCAIGIETGAAFAILALTAFLSQTAPPRSVPDPASHAGHEHAAPVQPFSAYVRSGTRAAVIEIGPATAGRNRILVSIVDAEGRRVIPIEMVVEIAERARGIEAVRRTMTPTPGGGFSHVGPEFSLPGTWTLRVEALVTDFEKAIFEATVPIVSPAPSR